jgi:hypothetical protein
MLVFKVTPAISIYHYMNDHNLDNPGQGGLRVVAGTSDTARLIGLFSGLGRKVKLLDLHGQRRVFENGATLKAS